MHVHLFFYFIPGYPHYLFILFIYALVLDGGLGCLKNIKIAGIIAIDKQYMVEQAPIWNGNIQSGHFHARHGPGKLVDGKLQPLAVKKGDIVLFTKYGPNTIKIDEKEYLIAKEDDILAVLK